MKPNKKEKREREWGKTYLEHSRDKGEETIMQKNMGN
jgi:hypothetical protein